MEASLLAKELFLRAAKFLWISPLVAALSTVFTATLYALWAASRSPADAAASNFLILVLISDLAALFRAAALWESRTLLDEDLIFGINPMTPPLKNVAAKKQTAQKRFYHQPPPKARVF